MSDGEELVIYQLRVALEGISPLIWRRLLVPGDYSIADLHFILQIAFDWDDVIQINHSNENEQTAMIDAMQTAK